MDLDALRGVVVRHFPELRGGRFALLAQGWDCVAVDVDDRLIFKFPRHGDAEAALRREAALLALIGPAVDMPVPAPTLHDGPPCFSRHAKLPGEHLLAAQYRRLPDRDRQRLAADMGRFYAQLHRLDPAATAAAGAVPIKPWHGPERILDAAWRRLPAALHGYAERTVAAWQDLPPDPHGITYGHFDGHGWNMAFDHARGRLNGLYDFADSGFGALHQEFVYPAWIDRDLARRIAGAYEAATGRLLDRQRIELMCGVLRLEELAEIPVDHAYAGMALQAVIEWAAAVT